MVEISVKQTFWKISHLQTPVARFWTPKHELKYHRLQNWSIWALPVSTKAEARRLPLDGPIKPQREPKESHAWQQHSNSCICKACISALQEPDQNSNHVHKPPFASYRAADHGWPLRLAPEQQSPSLMRRERRLPAQVTLKARCRFYRDGSQHNTTAPPNQPSALRLNPRLRQSQAENLTWSSPWKQQLPVWL